MNIQNRLGRRLGPQYLGLVVILSGSWVGALAMSAVAQVNQEQPATNQVAQTVQITDVRVESTDAGLQVVLETADGLLAEPITSISGNALILEIPNAVLAGEGFEEFDPTEGIAVVQVLTLPDGGVEVSITGTDAPPEAQVSADTGNLVLSITPGAATDAVANEDTLQLIVTATRTEEDILDVPRSVTVVTREDIENQSQLTTNLIDILGQTVPGLGPPTQNFRDFPQTLRGRAVQVLIDGVPISTNQNTAAASVLRSISPSAIEQIEVVRGPSAAFGEGATGGVINIITRRPTEAGLSQFIETRVNSRGGFDEDSFGAYVEYRVSGVSGQYDYVLNLSTEGIGFAFDGDGDQVPGAGNAIENARNFNILGKFGVEAEDQRFQVSLNYFDEDSSPDFINDPDVDDDPTATKARAEAIDLDCIDIECGDARRYISTSINYSHTDILGGELRLQGFYRSNYNLFGVPFEDRSSGSFIIGQQESDRFGGRVELETPFSEAFDVLWGLDYSNEESSQPYQVLTDEFVTSGFQVARLAEDVFFTPPYTVENVGLFAQAQWDVSPNWLLSGGVRYENIGLDVDDYTARLFRTTPVSVEGGSINADDVVFNIGTVYDITDELNVFANFSQGFGVPDFGRVLRSPADGFTSLEDDLVFTAPQKVNNYELGVRGQWQDVQFSLAGFYSDSKLGVRTETFAIGDVRISRAPQRNYGVEATVDWQPSDSWQLGSIFSWNEGESDPDDNGDFIAIRTADVQPLKITTYVENETLPGWRNRFQGLYVGGRDRGFDAGVDAVETDSYFVLDYVSSIDLGFGSVQVGIHNLLDTQYFAIGDQIFAPFSLTNRRAAPGRTFSIGYRAEF